MTTIEDDYATIGFHSSNDKDEQDFGQTEQSSEDKTQTPSEHSSDQSSIESWDPSALYATVTSVRKTKQVTEEVREQSTEVHNVVREESTEVVIEQSTEVVTEQSTELTERTIQQPEVNGSQLQCWPSRVVVTGTGLAGGVVGQHLTFHVDTRNGGPGEMTAFCTGPSQLAYCELTDHDNGTYTLSAKPQETGDHVLQVEYEGESVQGSPFTFPVTANHTADDITKVNGSQLQCWPSRVVVTGTGLAGGVVGQHLTFHVDARNGGPGLLAAYCTGPNRLAFCQLTDHGNGTFTLTAKPEEPGNHVLQVKYEEEPVLGSPFTFPVTASSRPDASRVRVSGPGVENGILSTFQSNFAVDTKGAGAGNLSIRLQGPKGAFRMEMSRMSQGDRKVFCHYNPVSSGVYVIIVRWSHVDVPGSPFHVKIFDHPDELERDQQRQN